MLLSSGLGVIEITFIFILMSSFSLKVDGNKAAENCTDPDKKNKCCTNYYNTNGTCTKCLKGTFGENCSNRCPDNMYGDLCAERCDCKANQTCNHVNGCIFDSRGICSKNSYDEVVCCAGYRLIDGYCKACPLGKYDTNCSKDCPVGRYGLFCKEICNCSETECDKARGCLKKVAGNNAPGNCTTSNWKTECCNNYFYAGGSCMKCPKGTFGKNCSAQCPKNMYGDLCTEKCDCNANQQCHHVHGCIDSESHFKTTGLIYWIIPVIIGIVIFIFISIYRRSQPRKRSQSVDIPVYQHEIIGNTRDNYDHMTDITTAKNGETINSRKLEATSSATMTRETGTSDVDPDIGVYHTLNLRVFDYEEPIRHEQLKRSQSENSSLYFECPARLMTFGIDMNNVSNCRRGSSLRQTRSIKDHIHESDEQKLTRKKHFVSENYVTKIVDNSEPTFDDLNVNKQTTLEKKNMVPQSKLFLNELSSHLLNLQKY